MRKMFFFVMMTAACCVQAQNEVERVLQSVEQHNTTLVALRHETEAAKVGNHTNLNLPNPEVEFGYLWGSPSSIGHRKDVSAVQSFDFATVTGAKRRLARQQDALADWQYKESRMQLLLEAHHLCLDAIYYNAMCKELMQRKQYAEEITSAQQKRLEQGDINRIEYNQVKLDLAAVCAELMRCNTERAAVMAELQRLNGGEPLLIEATDYPAVAIANDFEAWYAEAEQKSPALAYVKQQIDVANRELAVRRADGLPTVSLGFMGEYVSGENYQGVKVGMSIPLWANKNRVRQAKAEVEAAKARQSDARQQFYSRLHNLFVQQRGLRQVVQSYQEALRATDNTSLLKKALDAGSISTMDYLLGARMYYDAVNQKMDACRAWQKTVAEMQAVLL